jgi:hypothetical protein
VGYTGSDWKRRAEEQRAGFGDEQIRGRGPSGSKTEGGREDVKETGEQRVEDDDEEVDGGWMDARRG